MSIVRKHIKWAYDGIELERMVYSYPHTGWYRGDVPNQVGPTICVFLCPDGCAFRKNKNFNSVSTRVWTRGERLEIETWWLSKHEFAMENDAFKDVFMMFYLLNIMIFNSYCISNYKRVGQNPDTWNDYEPVPSLFHLSHSATPSGIHSTDGLNQIETHHKWSQMMRQYDVWIINALIQGWVLFFLQQYLRVFCWNHKWSEWWLRSIIVNGVPEVL